ncbi:hypothetical protein CSB45_03580 [candidate division KSB3 bacterium]|uniref:Secreted protein n=1 Tax=candidate division KSB3 bacterium TaxID=2044937 RepID=A0A2G6E9J2_9BACT|nr:MAG: hypothetical protein CSB45_03580 [candidate division KSB3 bacterium]PIE29575.1 MAG: hypothetical protein CSA57_08175 [candidate division KSB3 bacterium]
MRTIFSIRSCYAFVALSSYSLRTVCFFAAAKDMKEAEHCGLPEAAPVNAGCFVRIGNAPGTVCPLHDDRIRCKPFRARSPVALSAAFC